MEGQIVHCVLATLLLDMLVPLEENGKRVVKLRFVLVKFKLGVQVNSLELVHIDDPGEKVFVVVLAVLSRRRRRLLLARSRRLHGRGRVS